MLLRARGVCRNYPCRGRKNVYGWIYLMAMADGSVLCARLCVMYGMHIVIFTFVRFLGKCNVIERGSKSTSTPVHAQWATHNLLKFSRNETQANRCTWLGTCTGPRSNSIVPSAECVVGPLFVKLVGRKQAKETMVTRASISHFCVERTSTISLSCSPNHACWTPCWRFRCCRLSPGSTSLALASLQCCHCFYHYLAVCF